MPRSRITLSSTLPYHVRARCINKEWFQIPLPVVWEIYSDYLYLINKMYSTYVYSFVLMSNHFHLLLKNCEFPLDVVMNYFMRETSRCIARASGRINQIYGGPYGRTLIDDERHFLHAYKYVYRNPVEAGLVSKVEEYRFSTLYGLLGARRLIVPIVDDRILFKNPELCLKWLNTSYPNVQKEKIRTALRRPYFQISKDRSTNRPFNDSVFTAKGTAYLIGGEGEI